MKGLVWTVAVLALLAAMLADHRANNPAPNVGVIQELFTLAGKPLTIEEANGINAAMARDCRARGGQIMTTVGRLDTIVLYRPADCETGRLR